MKATKGRWRVVFALDIVAAALRPRVGSGRELVRAGEDGRSVPRRRHHSGVEEEVTRCPKTRASGTTTPTGRRSG